MKKVKSLLSLVLAVLMVAGCLATASATGAKVEAEPNDAIGEATVFAAGEEISGKLGSAADVDYLKFTAAKAGNATVTLKHTANTAASTYFAVEIQDADAKVITTFTSAGNSAEESAFFSVEKDETYYVVVTAGDIHDATLGYTVSVVVAEVSLSESEPNNTASEADALAYSPSGNPKEYYGSISAGDKDFYKVTIPADGVVNLYLYNYAANAGDYTATLKTYIEVGGVQTLTDIASIEIAESETSKVSASIGVAKGDYYLAIEGVDGSTGSYKTRVLFREVANVETEMNDSTANADVIAIGKTYKATLHDAGDKDCFKFTVPADNKGYDFAFKSTNAGDWTFKVLNSDGGAVTSVALKATNDSKTAKAEAAPLAAGTYYLEVSVTKDGIADAGIYELSITEKAVAPDDGKEEENKNLFDRIGDLNWGGLWDNFSGWIEQINFFGMISSITMSILKVFTYLGSMA